MEDNIDLDNDICGICYAEFLDIEDLKLHITQYHLNEANKHRFCKFCSRIFCDIDEYALHMRNSHLSTIKTCKYCTRVYNNAYSLSKHEKKHKSTIYYPKIACSHCIKVFKNKMELENHEYEKHRESEDGLMLQHCFPELSSLININIRKFFKGLHENYIYRCVVCEFSTENVTEYINHLLTKQCKSLSCNVCCNVYSRKSRLEAHCKTHKQFPDTLNNGDRQCLKCDKYFHFTKLKSHVKECTSMKCIPCDVSFDTVDKFALHVTTHSHRTPVQFENCKYCRRPFIGLSALQNHIERSHKHNLHLYKYNCIYCDIVFKHPKLLFGHFFTKHKDINPYTCKICNLGFRIRKNFTLHIKLDHKSVGFVEFDSNLHVFFTDKKSEKPFQPKNPDIADSSEKNTDEGMSTENKEESSVTTQDKETNKTEIITDTDKVSDEKIVISDKETANEFKDVRNEMKINQNKLQTEITENVENETLSVADKTDADMQKEQSSKELHCNESESKLCNNDSSVKTDKTVTKMEEINDVELKFKNKEPNLKLINVNSDFMIITETDVDQTENEMKLKNVQKRKLKIQANKPRKRLKIESKNDNSSDSDVPLSKIINRKPKRFKSRKLKRKRTVKTSKDITHSRKKMKFICFKCDRNCYTYQNYHRHMSLHMKNGNKICVKCLGKFKTKDELNNHMKTEHSTSKLTETLKKLLDKRKSNIDITASNEVIDADSVFSKTIKKVPIETNDSKATITKVENNILSVKAFLETFKPDTTDSTSKKISISNSLSIRSVVNVRTQPLIKMKKFPPEPLKTEPPRLRMPVKFKEEDTQEHKVTIKLVNCEYVAPTLNFDNEVTVADSDNYNEQSIFEESYDRDVGTKTELIPEVGREVLLEDTDGSKVKLLKKTIVLKDLLSYNNVRIGHLAPKAPFYKIVKIDDVLQDKQEKSEPPKQINITLPNGTKLVSVNPLAHLLGDKSVADIPKSNPYKNKPYSYKPKTQDFREAIVKAMKVLDKTPPKRKSIKKANTTE